jgi:hypothetical protein
MNIFHVVTFPFLLGKKTYPAERHIQQKNIHITKLDYTQKKCSQKKCTDAVKLTIMLSGTDRQVSFKGVKNT